MSPGKLILAHRYAQAAAILEERWKNRPHLLASDTDYATAMLCMRRYAKAADCFRGANEKQARILDGKSQPYLEDIGTAQWLMGKRTDAIATFRRAVDGILDGSIGYADLPGGVSQGLLLWYAGVTASDPTTKSHARNYLARLASASSIQYWPGPLALFLLRKKTEKEVLHDICRNMGDNKVPCAVPLDSLIAIAKSDAGLRRELVQTLFYFAARKRALGHGDACMKGMAICAAVENPIMEMEWYLARGEIDQQARKTKSPNRRTTRGRR